MTVGWENLLKEYLETEYGDGLVHNYETMVLGFFRPAETICPACGRPYGLEDCPRCKTRLSIEREGEVVRIVCKNCDVNYDLPRCKNDGSRLVPFLVGNHRTLFRPYGLLLFSDEEIWRTTNFYKNVCDISNVLPSLHYLNREKFLDKMMLDEILDRTYMWRKTSAGCEFEKKLLEEIFKPAGLLKPIKDFVQMRIEDGLKKNAELIEVDMSAISVYLPQEGRGEIKNKKGKIIIQHIRG